MITLDSIVNSLIDKAGRSNPHYYFDYMRQAKAGVRELSFDILNNVNTVIIKLNDLKEAPFPCDYEDYIKVGFPVGQYVRPLAKYDKISRLNNLDASGNKILYGTGSGNAGVRWGFTDGAGRRYGHGTGREWDVFKIIKERKVIQLDEHYPYDRIYLEFIGDGSCIRPSTYVDSYAITTVEAFTNWQIKANNRNSGLGEVRDAERIFTKNRDGLIARKADWTIEDVKRIYRRSYYGAIKH